MTRAVVLDNELPDLLASLTPFRTEAKTGMNNVRFEDGVLAGYREARKLPDGSLETGLLVDSWYAEFMTDHAQGVVDYVIYSYDTIIGWHCKKYEKAMGNTGISDGPARWVTQEAHWQVIDTMITATTAKHTWRVIVALRQKGLM